MKLLKVTRRRRSCLSREARSAAWGSMEDIPPVLEQKTEIDANQNEHKAQKQGRGVGGGKGNEKGKDGASAVHIRLKVKLGNRYISDLFPSHNDDLEENQGTPMVDHILSERIEEEQEEELPTDVEKEIILSNASMSALQLDDKKVNEKPEGKPLDIHSDILPWEEDEDLVVTVDNRCLYQETSPDSEVINRLPQQSMPQQSAWVCCDDCRKWRRIPATLADSIEETNCRWSCKENMDKDFADCSIPQEKSNSEINAELQIFDASDEEDACDGHSNSTKLGQKQSAVAQHSSWMLIKSNVFLHRNRKTQSIDEIMVCHCKPPLDGQAGCGDECLNRMLNIECIQKTCPCGALCSNRQFQKKKHGKFKWGQCGKKGYGLRLLEDVSKGRFLIEYVGEVLDTQAYKGRQREYALKGQKHFYFMALNGNEVIDACAKGNFGRFVNHSCDPNCYTEKWVVNGEVCIGLFALRDIKKGEEVTFDYNYVRVFGAAVKRCVCDSSQCRGYIGGDPQNAELIIQDDSDDEYPEPIMVYEHAQKDDNFSIVTQDEHRNEDVVEEPENIKIAEVEFNNSETEVEYSVVTVESEQSKNVTSVTASDHVIPLEKMEGSAEKLLSIETHINPDDITIETMSGSQQEKSVEKNSCSSKKIEISSCSTKLSKLFTDTESKCKSYSKSLPQLKTPRSASTVKIKKPEKSIVRVKKPPQVENKSLNKSKNRLEVSHIAHSEAVEEKLNELLDPLGGISRRKDATRGYLTLLLLTASSGNTGRGEAIKSNRDLSMILDALLKTKSRSVLVDVLNRNGLQMLHNIMKRYRREYIKIPIIQKLLKVLEHLAGREILTLEHINGGPPCLGVESFRESILTLTEHTDKQIHQTARDFRNKWIPRPIRKHSCNGFSASNNHLSEKSTRISEHQQQPTTEITLVDTSGDNGCLTNGLKPLKRKSRWDQPADPGPNLAACLKELKKSHTGSQPIIDEVDDFPPGFRPPLAGPPAVISSPATRNHRVIAEILDFVHEVAVGHPQERFVPSLSVSHGIPFSTVQQLGSPLPEAAVFDGWAVVPGVPFFPFPPLPPYPRVKNIATGHTLAVANVIPQTSWPVESNQGDFQQFRQQNWNNSQLGAPWIQGRNRWGFIGNNNSGVAYSSVRGCGNTFSQH